MYWLIFISGVITAFVFWSVFAGKYEGDKLKRSIRLKIGMYRIHIHHWIWCLAILVIYVFFGFYHPFILGVLIGSIAQGLTYKDRFVIFYKDTDFERIYSKYKLDK